MGEFSEKKQQHTQRTWHSHRVPFYCDRCRGFIFVLYFSPFLIRHFFSGAQMRLQRTQHIFIGCRKWELKCENMRPKNAMWSWACESINSNAICFTSQIYLKHITDQTYSIQDHMLRCKYFDMSSNALCMLNRGRVKKKHWAKENEREKEKKEEEEEDGIVGALKSNSSLVVKPLIQNAYTWA